MISRNKTPPSSEKKLKSFSNKIIKTLEKEDSTSDESESESASSTDELPFVLDSENPNEYEMEQVGFKSQCTIDMIDTVTTSIEEIGELMNEEEKLRDKIKRHRLDRLKFKAKIDPSKSKLAEEELQTEISKASFSRMEIIGQFNLGFIVVKLDDDLFIVDQHATDEKFNYETLQKETTLYNQKLVQPQMLELTAVSEMILIDNIGVFEKNGFKFHIDHNALPTKKVQLIAKPMSKNWEFGKDEIDELLFLLQESPNTVLRPSKIR